jgi:hypothetical protein
MPKVSDSRPAVGQRDTVLAMSQENVEIVREIMFNEPGRAATASSSSRPDEGAAGSAEPRSSRRSSAIWTLRAGQVPRMETDVVPEDALKAVGLTE